MKNNTNNQIVINATNVDNKAINGNTFLHQAVLQGNLQLVQQLMNIGANQNIVNEAGLTPLNMACVLACNARNNNNSQGEEIYQNIGAFLCNHEKAPDFKLINFQKQSPLSWIAELKNPALIKKVLKAEIQIDTVDGGGKTTLYWMIEYAIKDSSWIDMVKVFIFHGAKLDSKPNANSKNALDLTLASKNDSLIKAVLNTPDDKGNTILHQTVTHGRLDLVKLCMESGADQNIQNNDGLTPLYLACAHKKVDIAKFLGFHEKAPNLALVDKSGQTALSWIAELKDVELLEKAIAANVVNINAQDNNGKTLVSWMVEYASKDQTWNEMLKCLVRHKADVNICRNDKVTPLALATLHKNIEAVEVLMNSGANQDILIPISITTTNQNQPLTVKIDMTPLNLACYLIMTAREKGDKTSENNYRTIGKKLCDYNPDFNLVTASGQSPLSWIAELKNSELIQKVLVSTKMSIDAKGQDGKTLLMWMVQYAKKDNSWNEIVHFLVKKGAKIEGAIEIAGDNHEIRDILLNKEEQVIQVQEEFNNFHINETENAEEVKLLAEEDHNN